MIVVAIIGILAAIAVPTFVEMQLRAKRAEVPASVDGIKTSQMGYDAAYDGFATAASNPSGTPGKVPQPWDYADAGWAALGWAPDGDVRGQYSTTGGATDFSVTGVSDLDGDGVPATYTASKSLNAVPITASTVY